MKALRESAFSFDFGSSCITCYSFSTSTSYMSSHVHESLILSLGKSSLFDLVSLDLFSSRILLAIGRIWLCRDRC